MYARYSNIDEKRMRSETGLSKIQIDVNYALTKLKFTLIIDHFMEHTPISQCTTHFNWYNWITWIMQIDITSSSNHVAHGMQSKKAKCEPTSLESHFKALQISTKAMKEEMKSQQNKYSSRQKSKRIKGMANTQKRRKRERKRRKKQRNVCECVHEVSRAHSMVYLSAYLGK